ncbi:MAG: diaminopimelate epimerase [Terriglobia bacterium]
MDKVIRIPFDKLHGLGNDFIVTDAERRRSPQPGRVLLGGRTVNAGFLRRLAIAICERTTGAGADGFLLVTSARSPENRARVRFFNADGSEAEMSGNGIRCVGGHLLSREPGRYPLQIETKAGVKTLDCVKEGEGRWVLRVTMGRPILDAARIPFHAKNASPPLVGYPLLIAGKKHRVTLTSMGNPHCSLFVSNFEHINWRELGRRIEMNPQFPNRTNVEFVKVISKQEIEVKFWERGVGETASSGTGSCAAAAAAILNGFTGPRVRVRTLRGHLEVSWPDDGEMTLTGPAERIMTGIFDYWLTPSSTRLVEQAARVRRSKRAGGLPR